MWYPCVHPRIPCCPIPSRRKQCTVRSEAKGNASETLVKREASQDVVPIGSNVSNKDPVGGVACPPIRSRALHVSQSGPSKWSAERRGEGGGGGSDGGGNRSVRRQGMKVGNNVSPDLDPTAQEGPIFREGH